MASYSYADCLQKSYRVNWTIDEVIANQQFDLSRRWLPARLSGADGATCLKDDEKIKLSHVEMGAYAHLFGYVEEFIAPKMDRLALDFEVEGREAFDALTNFASEEVKHMHLFRAIRGLVDQEMGFPLVLLGDQKVVARYVLSKSNLAVLLLTSVIEWFTQLHYVTAFKDGADVDPFTKRIFKFHWLEESQHAKMDHLEAVRAYGQMDDAEKDTAIDDLIELVGAVDGLLQKQAGFDVQNLQQYLSRDLSEAETTEIQDSVLRAKRYTFIESGVTHPNFQELFGIVTTPPQQQKVQKALEPLLAPPTVN